MERCIYAKYVENIINVGKGPLVVNNDGENTTLSLDEIIAGWIGGICGISASHPMDTIKVVHQNGDTSFFKSIFGIYEENGLAGYYKGISVPAAMAGIQNAIFFGIYANTLREVNRWIADPNKEQTRIFIAGNMGGLGQVVFTTPAEVFKVHLQTTQQQHDRHQIFKTFKEIMKYRGPSGFYHGFIPTAFRDVPSGGLQLVIYTNVDNFLQQHINSYWSHMISGGLSGTLCFAPMTPFDFIKTRLQGDDIKVPVYSGLTDCIRKSYQQVGMMGFWRGFTMSSIRAFISNAVLFVVYELYLGKST